MKILLYLFYFFRSVAGRGLANTLRLLRAELRYEKRFGIRTSDIKKSDSQEFFHYQGASYLVLMRGFKEVLADAKDFAFTDIGCGKGRALCVAEHCGYSYLTGIELDVSLLEEAKQNVLRYVQKRHDSVFELIHANALEYAYKSVPMVYFLFNPFNEEVLRAVLKKIRTSTHAETWFIYMNPMYRTPFAEQGVDVVKEVKTKRYLEAVIYKWPQEQV